MSETVEHRVIRSKRNMSDIKLEVVDDVEIGDIAGMSGAIVPLIVPKPEKSIKLEGSHKMALLPEHYHIPRPTRKLQCQPTSLPRFLYSLGPKVTCNGRVQ